MTIGPRVKERLSMDTEELSRPSRDAVNGRRPRFGYFVPPTHVHGSLPRQSQDRGWPRSMMGRGGADIYSMQRR
jgi:hypothetical protein